MDNMDPLNTPVAFVSTENDVYIIKIEFEVVDPQSLYELPGGLVLASRGKD